MDREKQKKEYFKSFRYRWLSEKIREYKDYNIQDLSEEIKNRGIRLIYPIFIAYQKNITDQYHQSIKKCIDHIASEYMRLNIVIPASFDYRLFFIFLLLSEVKQIKENVIKWIDSREPLI